VSIVSERVPIRAWQRSWIFFSSEERTAPEIVDAAAIGPNHDGFVDFYEREMLPHFARSTAGRR